MELFKDCVGCTRRYVGCHSKYETHARDKARSEEIRRARFKLKEREDAIHDVLRRR